MYKLNKDGCNKVKDLIEAALNEYLDIYFNNPTIKKFRITLDDVQLTLRAASEEGGAEEDCKIPDLPIYRNEDAYFTRAVLEIHLKDTIGLSSVENEHEYTDALFNSIANELQRTSSLRATRTETGIRGIGSWRGVRDDYKHTAGYIVIQVILSESSIRLV